MKEAIAKIVHQTPLYLLYTNHSRSKNHFFPLYRWGDQELEKGGETYPGPWGLWSVGFGPTPGSCPSPVCESVTKRKRGKLLPQTHRAQSAHFLFKSPSLLTLPQTPISMSSFASNISHDLPLECLFICLFSTFCNLDLSSQELLSILFTAVSSVPGTSLMSKWKESRQSSMGV